MLSVSVTPIELPLVHPFRIARGEERVAQTAIVRVRVDEREGIGEAAPIERYGESVESVAAYFASHRLASDDPHRLEDLLHARVPFTGVRYDNGKLVLPDAPGLGVREGAIA